MKNEKQEREREKPTLSSSVLRRFFTAGGCDRESRGEIIYQKSMENITAKKKKITPKKTQKRSSLLSIAAIFSFPDIILATTSPFTSPHAEIVLVLKIGNENEKPTFSSSVLRRFFTAGGCDRESRGERKRKTGGERKKESRGERKMRDGY